MFGIPIDSANICLIDWAINTEIDDANHGQLPYLSLSTSESGPGVMTNPSSHSNDKPGTSICKMQARSKHSNSHRLQPSEAAAGQSHNNKEDNAEVSHRMILKDESSTSSLHKMVGRSESAGEEGTKHSAKQRGPHPSQVSTGDAVAEHRHRPTVVLRLQPLAASEKKKSLMHNTSKPSDVLVQAPQQQQPLLRPRPPLECDYDQSPTELYKLIENKKWSLLLQRLEQEEGDGSDGEVATLTTLSSSNIHQQASVWVVRKEVNGRLRWRLLPLHAAIIFQAPVAVTEALLEAYPAAASQKDDQGMLPLHLAFRNFGGSSSRDTSIATATTISNNTACGDTKRSHSLWLIIEELLTAFPAAVFSRDRKGRTPLQGGLLSANNETTGDAKAALTALQLYSTIQTAGEKNTLQQQQQAATDYQLATLQQQHATTLEELRGVFWKEHARVKEEHVKQIEKLQQQLEISVERGRQLNIELEETKRQLQTGKAHFGSLSIGNCSLKDAVAVVDDSSSKQRLPKCAEDSESRHPRSLLLQQQNQQLLDLIQEIIESQTSGGLQWKQLAARHEYQIQEHQQRVANILQNHKETQVAVQRIPFGHNIGDKESEDWKCIGESTGVAESILFRKGTDCSGGHRIDKSALSTHFEEEKKECPPLLQKEDISVVSGLHPQLSKNA